MSFCCLKLVNHTLQMIWARENVDGTLHDIKLSVHKLIVVGTR